MAINESFTFPEKENGLFGNLDYTWDFASHWPSLTEDYLLRLSGYSLSAKSGSAEKAAIELKKVMRLSKLFLFNRLPRNTQYDLEYIIAKDQTILYEVLEYQAHIFEAGFLDGGWLSMYETTDAHGIKSQIGKAAEEFIQSSTLGIQQYRIEILPELYRADY